MADLKAKGIPQRPGSWPKEDLSKLIAQPPPIPQSASSAIGGHVPRLEPQPKFSVFTNRIRASPGAQGR